MKKILKNYINNIENIMKIYFIQLQNINYLIM